MVGRWGGRGLGPGKKRNWGEQLGELCPGRVKEEEEEEEVEVRWWAVGRGRVGGLRGGVGMVLGVGEEAEPGRAAASRQKFLEENMIRVKEEEEEEEVEIRGLRRKTGRKERNWGEQLGQLRPGRS